MKEFDGAKLLFFALALLVIAPASLTRAQIQGLPASDQLGAEDGNGNPTFVGGVTNGGPTAHSEW